MKQTRYTLRALARLLAYPDDQLRSELSLLVDAIDEEAALPAARRAELRALAIGLQRLDPMEIESRYVETFDRGRATSLHLFEHVHGDSRDRGPAMIDLAQTYEKAGLFLSPEELPDHLCVVLEFASTQPPQVAKSFLGEVAHILNAIFSALLQRESPYAAVIAAVDGRRETPGGAHHAGRADGRILGRAPGVRRLQHPWPGPARRGAAYPHRSPIAQRRTRRRLMTGDDHELP